MVRIKTRREIESIRESCRIVADVLRIVATKIKPGVTTLELDRLAEEYIRSLGGIPAFKGYGSNKSNLFPATICASVDEVVVHGIPSKRALRDGEMLSVDVGVKKDGYFGDGAATFAVGRISEDKQRLMDATRESLAKGIEAAVVGNKLHDISYAVQQYVEERGYSVVRDLVGHGVGLELHEEPAVPNFGKPGTGMKLQEGMTLAIEPMVNAGAWQVRFAADGWTVLTQDGKPSAHFEHTIAIIDGKPEILTT
jgi:methionyl aminopeptidase